MLVAIADFKSKVKFYIWVYWGHAEVNLILIDVSLPNRSEVYRAIALLFRALYVVIVGEGSEQWA